MDDKSKNKSTQASGPQDSSLEEPAATASPKAPVEMPPETELSSQPENQSSGGLSSSSGPASKGPKWMPGFVGRHNIYILVLILLVLVAVGAIFASIKLGKNPTTKTSKTPSLTSQQLAELQGSTTIVGDAQQTLDVQSNSVFEGEVLLRKNLEVAGSIKVSGPLSLSSVTVGGTSTFGTVAVSGNLTVAGTTTLQKGLSVSGPASFGGSLSAAQLNVTTLQLTGDLIISRHIALSGGVPGRTNGTALGSGGTASVNGSDTGGTVTINTGGGPPAGCFVTINFVQKFNTTPHVIISPSNSSASSLDYYTNRSTTSFSVCTSNVPAASTTYLFDYIVIG